MSSKTEFNTRDCYKHYRNSGGRAVLRKEYLEIVHGFNQFIVDKVYDNYEVSLPGRMGTLSIVGTKKKLKFNEDGSPNLPPDYKKTKELWDRNPEAKAAGKKIYITNEHTDNVSYKYFWSKAKMLLPYKGLYSLKMTRTNKRRVWDGVVNKGKQFLIKRRL